MSEYISYYNVSELLKKISNIYQIPYKELSYALDLITKTTLNINYFNEDTEQAYYWAGFIAADGCVYKNSLIINLAEKDKKHLEKFKNSINYKKDLKKLCKKHSLKNPKWNDSIQYSLRFQSQHIIESLKKFNIVPNKTLTYKFPKLLFNSDLVHHFIRGYIDGDGSFWVDKNRKRICFELRGTKEFLSNVSLLFKDKLNLDINVTTPDSTSKIRLYGINTVPKLVDYLYKNANIYLERKYNIATLSYNRSLL